ncbi:MAG: hypothetical protein ACPL4H_10575 [Anaerolineales bacterium]
MIPKNKKIRYPLNLPLELKREAEKAAADQGVSLNQLVMWAVAEKVTALRAQLNDPRFPNIIYRRGAEGRPRAVLARTNLSVQTVIVAYNVWGLSPDQIKQEFDITQVEVNEVLAFYQAHRSEIDFAIQEERQIESAHSHA